MKTNKQLLKRQEIRRNYKDSDLAIQAIETGEVSLELFVNYGSGLIFSQKFMDKYKSQIESDFSLNMLMHKFHILTEYDMVSKYISIVLTNSTDSELDTIINTLRVVLRSQYYYNSPNKELHNDLSVDMYIDLVNSVNNIYRGYIDIIIDYLEGKDIKVPLNLLNTRQLFK